MTEQVNDLILKSHILKNCKFREQAWIVLHQLDTIIHETEKIYYNQKIIPSIPLNSCTIQYVYIAEMTIKALDEENPNPNPNPKPVKKEKASLFTIIEDNQGKYYLIKHIGIREVRTKLVLNQEPEKFEVTSRIDMYDKLSDLINNLPSIEKKKYNLKVKRDKKDKKDKDGKKGIKNEVQEVNGLSFINNWMNKDLLIQYITNQKETVDLSGLFLLNSEIFKEIDQVFDTVKTLIIYQNIHFTTFDYLKNFPNLETLSYWYSNITDQDLSALKDTKIQKLEFHHCNVLTGKCLPILAGMKFLTILLFDNQYMLFQKNTFSTILAEDVQDISNDSLETLILNAHNYTMDVSLIVLQMFTRLSKMVVPHDVYNTFIKNGYSGTDKEEISIQSYDYPKMITSYHKQLKFRNLLKSRYNNQPYSDAMMKVINSRPLQVTELNSIGSPDPVRHISNPIHPMKPVAPFISSSISPDPSKPSSTSNLGY